MGKRCKRAKWGDIIYHSLFIQVNVANGKDAWNWRTRFGRSQKCLIELKSRTFSIYISTTFVKKEVFTSQPRNPNQICHKYMCNAHRQSPANRWKCWLLKIEINDLHLNVIHTGIVSITFRLTYCTMLSWHFVFRDDRIDRYGLWPSLPLEFAKIFPMHFDVRCGFGRRERKEHLFQSIYDSLPFIHGN